MRLRKPEIGVVNADSVASASKIAQAVKFNYASQQLLNVIKQNYHFNKHCHKCLFSRHHGMTLQFDVRNDVDRVIKKWSC